MNGRWRTALELGLLLHATAVWAQPAQSAELSDGAYASPRYAGATTPGDAEVGFGWGALSFHVGVTSTDVGAERSLPPVDASGDYGPEGEAIAHRSDDDGERVNLLKTGLRYDPGRWFATAD